MAGAIIADPDEHKPLVLYGEIFTDGEKPEVPLIDYPAGLPAWMRELDGWLDAWERQRRRRRGEI